MDYSMPNATAPPLSLEASYVYVVEGLVLFLLNSILAYFIASNKRLRNEKASIIYLANILYDGMYTLGFILSGFFRLELIYECGGCTHRFFDPWICFNTVHGIIWIIMTPANGLIVFTSALDRLISVTFPLNYRAFPKSYTLAIVFIPIILSVPLLIFSGIESYGYRERYKVPVSCNIVNGDMPGLEYHLRSIRIASSLIAIMIYVPILVKIYSLVLKKSHEKLSQYELKRLIRSTFTIGLLATNELIFFVFPDIYLYLNPKTPITYILFVIILNKGAGNIIFLIISQRELRRSIIRRLFPNVSISSL